MHWDGTQRMDGTDWRWSDRWKFCLFFCVLTTYRDKMHVCAWACMLCGRHGSSWLDADLPAIPSQAEMCGDVRGTTYVCELLLAPGQAGQSVNTAQVPCSVFDVWSIYSRQGLSSGLGCHRGTLESDCVVIGRVPSRGISSYSPQPLTTNQQASDVAFPHTQEQSGSD